MRHFIFENHIGQIIHIYAKSIEDAIIVFSTEFNKIHKLNFKGEVI